MNTKKPRYISVSAAALRRWRTERGMTLMQAASALELPWNAVALYERGQREPSPERQTLLSALTEGAVPMDGWTVQA